MRPKLPLDNLCYNEHMTNILLASILGLMCCGIAAAIIGLVKVRRTLRSFVEPMGENQSSPLGQVIGSTSAAMADAIVNKAKSTFLGIQSGQARAEKALEADIVQDSLASNPLLAGIMKSFPALGKTLRRNPGLVEMALSKLAERAGRPGGGNGKAGSQVEFKL